MLKASRQDSYTNIINTCIHVLRRCLHARIVSLGGLFCDMVGCAELNIGRCEVVVDSAGVGEEYLKDI